MKIIDHLGNEFENQKEMCAFWGVSLSTFTRKKGQGYSLKECLTSRYNLFFEKVKWIHGDKVTILGEYINSHKKILVHCNVCDYEWEPMAITLTRQKNSGCPKCAIKTTKEKCTKHHNTWIEEINNDKVFILGTYKGLNHKVLVRCTNPECNHEWEARPFDIAKGKGCSRCQYKQKSKDYMMSKEEFEARLNKEHNHTIKCLSVFHGVNFKYDFKCTICKNIWNTTANSVINASRTGCPYCKESSYEKNVHEILTEGNVKFSTQYTFLDCFSFGGKLFRFDFSITDIGVIEVDGEYHFKPILNWDFSKAIKNDTLKTQYCEQHNIPLLRIRYDQIQNGTYIDLIEDFIQNPNDYITKHNKFLSEQEYYAEREANLTIKSV